jgi:protein TonB
MAAEAAAAARRPGTYGPVTAHQAPRGNGAWVTYDDYPPEALRAHQEGTALFTLDIDVLGCPTRCTITRSTGFAILDDATCAMLLRRAQFKPAVDGDGKPIPATWSSKFRWQIQ